MIRTIQNRRGLSLLEVMISMIILAIGILGLAPLLVVSMDSNSHSRDLSLAMQLARDKLELLESSSDLDTYPNVDTESNLEDKYSRTTYLISSVSDTLIPEDRYKAIVIVTWKDDKEVEHNTQMSTLIGKE